MRIFSFLFVSFLIPNFCFAYTVVFLSGKQVTGTLFGEDSTTIQLRDSAGVILSIKKSCVDLTATERANTIVKPKEPNVIASVTPQPLPEKSLGELAREERARRKGQSRNYTSADLGRVREISFGNEEPESIPEIESRKPETTSELQNNESYWRKAAAEFRKELGRLRERKISAQLSCQKAREKRSEMIYGGKKRPTNLSEAFDEPAECERLQEIESQLKETEWRWDEFTERARKSSVPWSWIE